VASLEKLRAPLEKHVLDVRQLADAELDEILADEG